MNTTRSPSPANEGEQLVVLAISFPGWKIYRDKGDWCADLRRDVTERLRGAGVLSTVREPTHAALTRKLSDQGVRIAAARRAMS